MRWWWWIWGLALAGCDDDAAAPDAAVPCEGSTYRGVIRAFDPAVPFDQLPVVASVQACNGQRSDLPCATSDLNGEYLLDCVAPGDALLTFEHPDFVPSAWLRVATGGDEQQDVTLLTASQNATFYAPVSTSFPLPGHGVIAVNDTTHVDGIVFSATGAQGPFYSRDGLSLDTAATSTVGDGLVFFIAPAGVLTIEITPPAGLSLCGHASGGFLSTGHGLTVPVREGTEVGVFTRCR